MYHSMQFKQIIKLMFPCSQFSEGYIIMLCKIVVQATSMLNSLEQYTQKKNKCKGNKVVWKNVLHPSDKLIRMPYTTHQYK